MFSKMRLRASKDHDAGMSLVEVIVSLSILAVVMSAAALFFISGLKSTNQQSQRQNATQLTNQALEATTGQRPDQLLAGRYSVAVSSMNTTYGGSLIAQDYLTDGNYDTTASAASVPAIPLSQAHNLNNVAYTVRTFINQCYVDITTGTCGATKTTSQKFLYRITVVTSWVPGAGRSCPGGCQYSASTLVDAHGEPTFNTNISTPVITSISNAPVAVGVSRSLTINGTGFVAGAVVSVASGGGAFGAVTSNSGTAIVVPFTAGSTTGTYLVTVLNSDGGRATQNITLDVLPAITSVSPGSIVAGSATVVTLTGTGFQSGATVGLAGGSATAVTFVSSTSVRVTLTGASTGAQTVTLMNPDGGVATKSITVTGPPPAVLGGSQGATNLVGQATTVTLTGTGFVSGATVTAPSSYGSLGSVVSSSATSLTFSFTPSQANPSVPFTVTNPDQQSATGNLTVSTRAPFTLGDVTYVDDRAKANVITLTLTGTGFVGPQKVALSWNNGAGNGTSVIVGSSTQSTFSFDFPDGSFNQSVTFTVTNGDNTQASTTKTVTLK